MGEQLERFERAGVPRKVKAMGSVQVTTPIAGVLRKSPRADEMGTWEAAANFAFLATTPGAPGSAPTIAECLNAGCGWLDVMCHRSETRGSVSLDAIRRPPDTPIWQLEAVLKCRAPT